MAAAEDHLTACPLCKSQELRRHCNGQHCPWVRCSRCGGYGKHPGMFVAAVGRKV